MRPLIRSPLRAVLSAMLLIALPLSLTACPGPASEVSRVADKAAALSRVVQTFDPAGQLAADGLITRDEAGAIRTKALVFGAAVTSFAGDVRAALDADPKADLVALLPSFAKAVSSLNELGALRLNSARAQAVFDKMLSGVRLSVAYVSAFYAARVVAARTLLERAPSERASRAILSEAGITYDPGRLARARADFKSAGRARALSGYYATPITGRDVSLVTAAASWGT